MAKSLALGGLRVATSLGVALVNGNVASSVASNVALGGATPLAVPVANTLMHYFYANVWNRVRTQPSAVRAA